MSRFSHREKEPKPTYDWATASRYHGSLEKAIEAANQDSVDAFHHMHPTACQQYYCGHCSKMMPLVAFPHPHAE